MVNVYSKNVIHHLKAILLLLGTGGSTESERWLYLENVKN